MPRLKLIKPSEEYAEQIAEYRREFLASMAYVKADQAHGLKKIAGTSWLEKFKNPLDWIKQCNLFESYDTIPNKKYTTGTQYMSVSENSNKLIGMLAIRHELKGEEIINFGGHIGYSIRPSERRKGYAKEQLRLGLIKAKEHGLDRVLICCAETNEASKRTILANGGKFERKIYVEESKLWVDRYWVELR
jgi:predicted acetyltransferase